MFICCILYNILMEQFTLDFRKVYDPDIFIKTMKKLAIVYVKLSTSTDLSLTTASAIYHS